MTSYSLYSTLIPILRQQELDIHPQTEVSLWQLPELGRRLRTLREVQFSKLFLLLFHNYDSHTGFYLVLLHFTVLDFTDNAFLTN